MQQDRQEDATRALAKLHAQGDITDPYVQAEIAEIVSKIQWEKQNPPPSYFKMLFGSESRRTWLGIGAVRNFFHAMSERLVQLLTK